MTDPIDDPAHPIAGATPESARGPAFAQDASPAAELAPGPALTSELAQDASTEAQPAPTPGPTPHTPPAGTGAAEPAAASAALPMLVGRRQFARTTPVVVDRGRASFGLPTFGDRRQAGQIGLVILMIAALGAILLARSGEPGTPGIADGASPSPVSSLGTSIPATPSPSPVGSASPVPGGSAPASPKPSATPRPRTYTVKSGDTLSTIASRFHTTVKAIVALNALKSPYVLHPGQVLKLP